MIGTSKQHPLLGPATLLVAIVLGLTVTADEVRTWTGTNGKQVEAIFLRTDGNMVSLQASDGKMFQTRRTSLSAADQQYIKELIEAQRAAAAARIPKVDPKLIEKYELAYIALNYHENKLDPNTLVLSGTIRLVDNKNTDNLGALECWMTVELSEDGENWFLADRAPLPTAQGLQYGGGVKKNPASFEVIIQTHRAMSENTRVRVRLRNGKFDGKPFLYVTEDEYKLIKAVETGKAVVQSAPASVEYKVVKRWSIPNGGWGKCITISPTHANEQDLTALAQRIKRDVQSDRNAMMQVFTSREAAEMRDRLDSLSVNERAIYHKAYVGRYLKNGNIGLEEMEIHPSGMDGPSKTLTP